MNKFRFEILSKGDLHQVLGVRQIGISVRAKWVTLGEQTRVNSHECRSAVEDVAKTTRP
jgi:hypothetical protein